MNSRFGQKIMVVIMAIGFFLSVGYALSSSHLHNNHPQQQSSENTQ